MSWCKKSKGKQGQCHSTGSTAKVVDGTLILSLKDAVNPVVWQMSFGQTKSSALEVLPRKQGDGAEHYVLTLKTPKGDVTDIAPFDDRDKAVAALGAISFAMENAHGQIRPGSAPESVAPIAAPIQHPSALNATNASSKSSIMAGFLGLGILAVLIFVLVKMAPSQINIPNVDDVSPTTGASSATGFNPAGTQGSGESGVPLKAEDFLMKRK